MAKPKKDPEEKDAERNEFDTLLRKATGLYMIENPESPKTRQRDVLRAALVVFVADLESRATKGDHSS